MASMMPAGKMEILLAAMLLSLELSALGFHQAGAVVFLHEGLDHGDAGEAVLHQGDQVGEVFPDGPPHGAYF